jgi:hypothetical protein
MSRSAVVVRSLASHASTPLACRSFASLERCSDRPLKFVVHDDGTLQVDDQERLRAAVRDVAFVERAAADAFVEPLLSGHPRCRQFRRANPLALKLLDIPLMAEGAEMVACDTDIYAFRPFSALFDFPDAETTGVFMRDTQNAYSIRPWHLVASGIALPMYLNTGLMLFRTHHHDLDFVEWFLGRQYNVYRRIPGWVEQTCWAALADRTRARLYDPAQVRVVRDAGCLTDDALVIGHFTADVRHLWERTQPGAHVHAAPRIRTEPTRRLSGLRLATEQARRLGRRGRRWMHL